MIRNLEQHLFTSPDLPATIKLEVCEQPEDDWKVALDKLLPDNDRNPPPKPNDDHEDEEDDTRPKHFIGVSTYTLTRTDRDSGLQIWLQYLAFATSKRVLVLNAPENGFGAADFHEWDSLASFLEGVLDGRADAQYTFVGFEMASTMTFLWREGVEKLEAIDLSDIDRTLIPSTVIEETIGKDNIKGRDRRFEKLWRRLPDLPATASEEDWTTRAEEETLQVAWRAWMAAVVAQKADSSFFKETKPLDLSLLTAEHMRVVSDIQKQYDLAEAAKPTSMISEFSSIEKDGSGGLLIKQAAFKNKARKGRAQDVHLVRANKIVAQGRVIETEGKTTNVQLMEKEDDGIDHLEEAMEDIEIEIHGREDLTRAEAQRNRFIARLLQGQSALDTCDFIRKIWLPSNEDIAELNSVGAFVKETPVDPESDPLRGTQLNRSQAEVARAMLSEQHSIALVHGPPGTGKTRTISEVVKVWCAAGKCSYLTAQTNVGVKNIAEALIKVGIEDFRLLVSNDFFREWHEDHYTKCREYMIPSNDFKDELPLLRSKNIKVILCTVNMLQSARLQRLFVALPLERLIVDEASQIFVGDYLALFNQFRATLRKVCWFGDPKQLPPHQREQINGLSSIYDLEHMKDASLLLDTQYRMPPEIGRFVSAAMYGNRLRSWENHSVPGTDCLRFIDAAIGCEEKNRTSWVNHKEADIIVKLVQLYYQPLSFSVITPYDSQRKLIERKLKAAGLNGEGRCYNLDSFQGNEDEFILISCVRTKTPGFLDLHNRINVMLTRCKQGMVVVAHKEFLRVEGKMTMVGRLAEHWSNRLSELSYEADDEVERGAPSMLSPWAYYREVLNKHVDLPGARGTPPPTYAAEKKGPKQSPVNGFYAIPPEDTPPTPGWGASVKSTPTNATLIPSRRTPDMGRSTAWGGAKPAFALPVVTPTGAWGAGKPKLGGRGREKTIPEPPSAGFTITGLPSRTGSSGPSKRGAVGQKTRMN